MFIYLFILMSVLHVIEGYHMRSLPSRQSKLQMKLGRHGENFKYLTVFKGKSSEHFPRTVPIAGMYPELTPEDVLAPAQLPLVMPGQFTFDFSDASGPQLGTIAVPGSDVLTFADDPVAIITHNSHLGIKSVSSEGVEIVAVVDRADLKFNPDLFYIWRSPDNVVEMGSMDRIEEGYSILGRIILTMVPYVKGDSKPSTGFLEEDGEDDE